MSEPRFARASVGWFYACFALLPITYVRGLGLGYPEPKRLLLILLCLGCLASLGRRFLGSPGPGQPSPPLRLNAYVLGTLALTLIRFTSLFPLTNAGYQLDSISASICMLIIGLYIANTELNVELLGKMLLAPVMVVLAGVVLKILFGISYFPQPYAIFVNLKNAVAVFLVAAVPFVLVAFPRFWRDPAGGRQAFLHGVAVFALQCLIFWAALCYRTRSSWWMIAVYVVALAVIWARTRQPAAARLLLVTVLALVMAVLMLKLLPTVMVWRSQTPYLDSLMTMASLEKSSGRKDIWQVALHMIRSHPARGVGTGGFPSQWVAYIAGSGVDPRIFALQTRSSPAFNDYLHMTAELGVLPGLLFAWLGLGLPVLYLHRQLRTPASVALPELLVGLCSLALGLDALFDFPFLRPEAYLLHAVSLSFLARAGGSAAPRLRLPRRPAILCASLLAAFLALNFTLMGVGLWAKKSWLESGRMRALELALSFWPWDVGWSHLQVESMLAAGRLDLAEQYARTFARAWPHDAEAALTRARLAEAKQDFRGALLFYQRAIVKVPGGRCHEPGYTAYLAMQARPQVQGDPALRLSARDLAACAR